MSKVINLYNTLGREKQIFQPIEDKTVKIYHCGPTVYWSQHIGNMRAVFFADIVKRFFEYQGYRTILVRNYTDVGHLSGDNQGDADSGEDRMAIASKRENVNPDDIANKYIAEYVNDISLINTIPPNESPKATENIKEMVEMVETLLKKGFAYSTDYAIYFDVSKANDYTKLSLQKLKLLKPSSGHGDAVDKNKINQNDFALWFFKAGAHKNALQTWPSPFSSPLVKDGTGFPGWHIECSAMSKKFLGETFDIHIGGIEHVPIHHTNEIAQSESANGKKYVNYWLHNEHLLVDNKKMSKSEGTSYLVKDILEKDFDPISLRMFFLQSHYRSKQNFTWDALQASDKALKKIKSFVNDGQGLGKIINLYKDRFDAALCDDLNTPAALAVVFDLMKDTEVAKDDRIATILHFDSVLGLRLNKKEEQFYIPEEVLALAKYRTKLKEERAWKQADTIRDEVLAMGYKIIDKKDGYEIVPFKTD